MVRVVLDASYNKNIDAEAYGLSYGHEVPSTVVASHFVGDLLPCDEAFYGNPLLSIGLARGQGQEQRDASFQRGISALSIRPPALIIPSPSVNGDKVTNLLLTGTGLPF